MKHKFSSMGRLAIALVLALSLILVMGLPVNAAVTSTVAVDPPTINAAAEYTVTITTTVDLSKTDDDDIRIEFPEGTTVPEAYVNKSISINDTDVDTGVAGIDVIIEGRAFTIDVPVDIPFGAGAAVVIFKIEAGIVNPSTAADDTYTLFVSTSEEVDSVASATYNITAPTITLIEPASGNMGDTMWVEITGNTFEGDPATNVSDTVIDFGDGIEVLSTKYVSPTEIDCEIEITTAGGARTVLAIVGGTGAIFTSNVTGTPQVDVWEAYDLITDPFVAASLDFQETLATISLAETACGATETVIVHADTYEEQVIIDQSITLQSLSGAATTIIEGANECVEIHASTVVLGGSAGHGFTLQEATGTVHLVQIFGDLTTITISDNTFIQSSDGVNAIMAAGAVTDLTVERNDFTLPCKWGMGVLVTGTADTLTVTDNDFTGGGSDVDNSAIELWSVSIVGSTNDTVISLNDFTDLQNGILIGTDTDASDGLISGGTASNLEISGNTFDSLMYAIDLVEARDDGGDHNVVITENIFTTNTIALGINAGAYPEDLDVWDPSEFVVKYNDFDGNTCGISNKADLATVLAAHYNYWGEIGGPSAGTTTDDFTANTAALGNGDTISDDVTYDPWLSVSQVTVIDEGIRYYGSDTLELEKGWNTLSVPVVLYDLANSISEIELMGDFLTADNYADYILEYDPAGEGWLEPTTLVPCRGYYIKMKAASNFPVLYNNSLGLPAFDLAAGWNLIGSAFGIDKLGTSTWAAGASETGTHDGGDGQAAMTDSAATFIEDELIGLTIENVTDGSSGVITDNDTTTVTATLTGGTDDDWDDNEVYSIPCGDTEAIMGIGAALDSIGDQVSAVISPSAPGQIGDPWSAIWATDDVANPMYTGEGYWVFMTDTGTLAGWEITPFYFTTGTMPD